VDLSNSRLKFLLMVMAAFCETLQTSAQDQPVPTFGSMIGGLRPSKRHSYIAESHVELPLLHVEPLGEAVNLFFRYRETTPFFLENAQAQLLYRRFDLETNFALGDFARLITVAGYRSTQFEDRPGARSAYVFGGGFGSPMEKKQSWLEWSVAAGGYIERDRMNADWWADVHALWRIWEFPERQSLETTYRPSLGLAVDIESANDSNTFRGFYKAGPVLDLLSANGNRVRFHARWYHTDGNPFLEDRDTGLLLGVEVIALSDKKRLFNAREERPVGWLPLVWGQYELGYGSNRMMQRMDLNVEIHDHFIAGHRVTGVLWYESHQEQREGDYDNISYSISTGAQTVIGMASPLSQGDPLVFGADYVHRSGHALNPDKARVPAGKVLMRHTVHLLPRLRLQTQGWDLPYRDPTMYEHKTEWLNFIDWRITLGFSTFSSRSRRHPAAQLGLNWDIATVQGNVIYLRGIGSVGNEIPDWQAEIGVRWLSGTVFIRAERFGLERHLGGGNSVVVGFGFNL